MTNLRDIVLSECCGYIECFIDKHENDITIHDLKISKNKVLNRLNELNNIYSKLTEIYDG